MGYFNCQVGGSHVVICEQSAVLWILVSCIYLQRLQRLVQCSSSPVSTAHIHRLPSIVWMMEDLRLYSQVWVGIPVVYYP